MSIQINFRCSENIEPTCTSIILKLCGFFFCLLNIIFSLTTWAQNEWMDRSLFCCLFNQNGFKIDGRECDIMWFMMTKSFWDLHNFEINSIVHPHPHPHPHNHTHTHSLSHHPQICKPIIPYSHTFAYLPTPKCFQVVRC